MTIRVNCRRVGDNGQVRLSVDDDGAPIYTDVLDPDLAMSRQRFVQAVLSRRPSLPEEDLEQAIFRATTLPEPTAPRGAKADSCRPIGSPRLVDLATVTPKQIEWLWPNRIPLGKLTLFAGNPGLGKSLLTLDLASRVSRGFSWPDGAEPFPPSDVVLISAEDSVDDTIVPRLIATGADRSRVKALQGVEWYDAESQKSTTSTFSLERDIPALETAIGEVRDVRLVVVDPISAYLGRTDSHKNSEIRGLLAPLAELAEKAEVAIVAVTHLNKGTGPAIYRATGSLAFVAAARAVWGVIKDKQNPAVRLMLPIKCNLAADTSGLSYTVMASDTMPDTPVLAWSREPVSIDADDALDQDDTTREVQDWLRIVLQDGPANTNDIQREARECGHAWRTVQRAKDKLGIIAERKGFGRGGRWIWRLPDA